MSSLFLPVFETEEHRIFVVERRNAAEVGRRRFINLEENFESLCNFSFLFLRDVTVHHAEDGERIDVCQLLMIRIMKVVRFFRERELKPT